MLVELVLIMPTLLPDRGNLLGSLKGVCR